MARVLVDTDVEMTRKYGSQLQPLPTRNIKLSEVIENAFGNYDVLACDLVDYAKENDLDVVVPQTMDLDSIYYNDNGVARRISANQIKRGMEISIPCVVDDEIKNIKGMVEEIALKDEELYIVTNRGELISTFDIEERSQSLMHQLER